MPDPKPLTAAEQEEIAARKRLIGTSPYANDEFLRNSYTDIPRLLASDEAREQEIAELKTRLSLNPRATDAETLADSYLGAWQTAERELTEARAEIERLWDWKDSQIQVESEWDAQAVGRALNLRPGSSIRAQILPTITRLQSALEAVERAIEGAPHFGATHIASCQSLYCARCYRSAYNLQGSCEQPGCQGGWGEHRPCNCWKASALAAIRAARDGK